MSALTGFQLPILAISAILAISRLCSFVSFVVQVSDFPIPAMSALCAPSPSRNANTQFRFIRSGRRSRSGIFLRTQQAFMRIARGGKPELN